MTAKSNRQAMIDKLMSSRYASDHPKNDSTNRAFLESLSTPELEKMVWQSDHEEIKDEFELDGEIRDIDFGDEEINLFN